jgi:ABC-type transport system substrate-binding protein
MAAAVAVALATAGATAQAGVETATATATDFELHIVALEPASLLPAEATDPASVFIVRQLNRGLTDYDLAGQPVLDLADSITQVEDTVWEIGLRGGFMFHDFEAVDAAAFVRGWTYAATGPNAHLFEVIDSVDVVDSHTLQVLLDREYAELEALLAHPAFAPMSTSCLADVTTCRDHPIGNGPYQFGDRIGAELTLVRYDLYPDAGEAVPDTLRFELFPDLDSVCETPRLDAPDLFYPAPDCQPWFNPAPVATATETGNTFTHLGLPLDLPELADPRVRRALSLAIDRQEIIDGPLDAGHHAADSLVSPHTDGYRPGICTDCSQDQLTAQQLLADAGGWQGGELELWAPAGAGHEVWLTAVGEQLHDVLGIDYRLETGLALPDYLAAAAAGSFTGPFWWDQTAQFAAMDAYLTPLFHTDGTANVTGYSDPDVDELLGFGETELSQQAEEIVLDALPLLPLWFDEVRAYWRADQIDTLVWNAFHGPEIGLLAEPA